MTSWTGEGIFGKGWHSLNRTQWYMQINYVASRLLTLEESTSTNIFKHVTNIFTSSMYALVYAKIRYTISLFFFENLHVLCEIQLSGGTYEGKTVCAEAEK